MFVAGTLTQEQDIIKPNCVQKTICCFVTRLPLVKQVLNLRLLQFRWFVGILSLQLKLRNTSGPSDENQITCVALKNPESYKENFIRSETINK